MSMVQKVSDFVAREVLEVKKNSPAILLGAGIVLGVGAAYATYRSRPKVEKVVEKIENTRRLEQPVDKLEVAKDLTKALALPIGLGVLSVGSFMWSYNIQLRRIKALAGMLVSTQAAQVAFENAVKKQIGETAYNELKTLEEQTIEVENEDGTTEERVAKVMKDMDSNIGEWYDKSSEYFSDDHDYNMAMIDSMEGALDLRLFQRGYLLLNEVREKLGFERTRSGALLGWTTAEYFGIEKIVVNVEDPLTGEKKPEIFVKWSPPRYIYDDVDYNTAFDEQ